MKLLSKIHILALSVSLSFSALVSGYEISAVTMFQNEAPYLREWIEFHKVTGVDHFYMYNNASTDDYMTVLQPYIDSGEVELFQTDPTNDVSAHNWLQTKVYKEAIQLSRAKSKWLLIIDSDEFVVPSHHNNLRELLDEYDQPNIGGVFLSWVWFGTSYIKEVPEGELMTEHLHMNKGPVPEGKSIVRPDRTTGANCLHRCSYHGGYIQADIPIEEAQINHYWGRDEKFAYGIKLPRRQKWGLSREHFNIWLNDGNRDNPHYYSAILKYIPELKTRMFSDQYVGAVGDSDIY